MSIPRMNYPQYRKARKLTHECCNYCDGNCLLLDDGEECVCVQSISYLLTPDLRESEKPGPIASPPVSMLLRQLRPAPKYRRKRQNSPGRS